MTGRRGGTSGMLGWGKGRVYVSLRQEIKKYSQIKNERKCWKLRRCASIQIHLLNES